MIVAPAPEVTSWNVAPRRRALLDILSCCLGGVCTCLLFLLVVFTEIVGRCEIPISEAMGWGRIACILILAVVGIASILTGVISLFQKSVPRRFAIAGIVLSLSTLLLFLFCARGFLNDADVRRCSRGCSKHIEFIGASLWHVVECTPSPSSQGVTMASSTEGFPDIVLPATEDLKAVLLAITPPGVWDRKTLDGFVVACPESHLKNREIGYIYIGDGLRLHEVVQKGIPIIFCPASNHSESGRFCCVWPNREAGMSNEEVIALFEGALARAKSGEIPYSPRAISVLEREVAARKLPLPGAPLDRLLLSGTLALAGITAVVAAFHRKRHVPRV